MSRRNAVTVVCTGRGRHKQHNFNQFLIDGAEVTLKTFRNANAADLGGQRDQDGAEMVSTALLPAAYDPRLGRDAYRWDCPHCPVDLRISRNRFDAWVIQLRDDGKRVCDVSTRDA